MVNLPEPYTKAIFLYPESDSFPYFKWHEQDDDWLKGSGRLLSVTHQEVLRLWAVPNLFTVYEAFLKRFISAGGISNRIFVVSTEYLTPKNRNEFLRALYRHYLLGFNPHIVSILDLNAIKHILKVDCQMFGILNDCISYYFRFPIESQPVMVRTIDATSVKRAIKAHSQLWNKSEHFVRWMKVQKFEIPNEIKKLAQDDAILVEEIARRRIVSF